MIDLKLAKTDPAQIFKHPEDVLIAKELSRHDKIDILERWAYDEREKAVAEEENMASLTKNGDVNILDEISRCLIMLGVDHNAHPTPTKHK